MTDHSPIRYGILGFGDHAVRRLVPGFAQAQASILNGLWRRDAKKAMANAREFGIHSFATAQELCTSPQIDAVFVASPDALHHHDTLLAISAGKAVLCEKPLAMNAREAEEMLAAARDRGVLFGVAQNFRYNRSIELIRDWLAQGRIGKPALAQVQFTYNAAEASRAWIYDPSLACGGPIGDVGIHCIDALRFVLGDEVSSVSTVAIGDTRSGAVESSGAIGLRFAGGVVGSIAVSTRAAFRTLLEVSGENGIIHGEDALTGGQLVDVVLRRGGKTIEQQQVSNVDGYTRMLDAFSAAFHGRASYAASGEDGLRNQRVLDASYASLRSGRQERVG